MTSLLRRPARALAAAAFVLPAAFLVPQTVVAAPTVAFTAPAEGGALSGNVQGPPHCIVTGSNISRVMFYIDGQWTNTDGNLANGLGCWIDTTKYRDGSYTLTAVAYDSAGATATARRSIAIRNSAASSGPTISWQAPAAGGALSGNVQGPPHCIVNGANIARVMFYINGQWTNTDGNLDNGLGCWIDTTKYTDGAYTLKAVAYDATGRTAEASRSIVIKNSTTPPAPSGPTISWKAPAQGGTLSGNVQGPPHCIVEGANVQRVMFYLNGQWINTDGNLDNGLGCWVDTTKYKDGTYTVKAVAYDASGRTAEASRSIVIKNATAADPKVQWRAGMETGNLSEWSNQVNSGAAQSFAVTAASAGIPALSGNWVMQQSVTGSSGGTRMERYPEIEQLVKAGTPFYVSWWNYYPKRITFSSSNMFMLWQIVSRDSAGAYHPTWGVFLDGSNSTLKLLWDPARINAKLGLHGPHSGESGFREYKSNVVLPAGQWVFFEIMVKPAADYTGAVKIWMNGQLVADQSNVKTRYPDSGLSGWMGVTHNAYGSGLTPTPATHYVDDVTISLGRMPHYAQ